MQSDSLCYCCNLVIQLLSAPDLSKALRGLLVSRRPNPTYLSPASLKEPDAPETTSLLCNKSRAGNGHSRNLHAAITELPACCRNVEGTGSGSCSPQRRRAHATSTRRGSPGACLAIIWSALRPRSLPDGRSHGCKGGAVEAPDRVVVWDVYGCRDTVNLGGRKDRSLLAAIRR